MDQIESIVDKKCSHIDLVRITFVTYPYYSFFFHVYLGCVIDIDVISIYLFS